MLKAYIPAHTRKLADGRVVQVRAYTDKRTRQHEDGGTLDLFGDHYEATTLGRTASAPVPTRRDDAPDGVAGTGFAVLSEYAKGRKRYPNDYYNDERWLMPSIEYRNGARIDFVCNALRTPKLSPTHERALREMTRSMVSVLQLGNRPLVIAFGNAGSGLRDDGRADLQSGRIELQAKYLTAWAREGLNHRDAVTELAELLGHELTHIWQAQSGALVDRLIDNRYICEFRGKSRDERSGRLYQNFPWRSRPWEREAVQFQGKLAKMAIDDLVGQGIFDPGLSPATSAPQHATLAQEQEEAVSQAPVSAKPIKLSTPPVKGQRRAKPGGEIGVNGEWYEGGKWIANTDRAKHHKPTPIATGREIIEPGVWAAPPRPQSRSIYSVGGFSVWMQQDGNGLFHVRHGLSDNDGTPITSATRVRPGIKGTLGQDEYTLQELLDRYHRGDRWLEVRFAPDEVLEPEPTDPQLAALLKQYAGDSEVTPAELTEAVRQYREVESRYRGTDQWLKAPNGQPSNLNERQWVLVRTPNFKKWFGDWEDDPENASKVVDKNDEPLVVHHFTDSEPFVFFDRDKLGSNTRQNTDQDQAAKMATLGFWFSDTDIRYTKERGRGMFAHNQIDVFVSLRNPKIFDTFEDMWEESDQHELSEDWKLDLEIDGYDGVIVKNDTELGGTSYVVFDSDAGYIKSANGNAGTFRSDLPSLTKSILLLLPSGNRYFVLAGDYAWVDDNLLAKALNPGERWITVHPGGDESRGVPVLVKETQHGSGVFHVIGGAGGKLNYLKLRGLAPEESYKENAAKRRKAKQEVQQQQAKRDKELGLDKAKSGAKKLLKIKTKVAEQEFIQTVAKAMQWQADDLVPTIPADVSEATAKRLESKHHAELLRKAQEAVQLQVQNLATDAEERGQALATGDITDVDLDATAPAEQKGLGFAAKYAERAAEQGAGPLTVQAEAQLLKLERQANLSDSQRQAIKTRGDTAIQVKAEIANLREPVLSDNIKASLADARQAAEMIKASIQLKAVHKQVRAAKQDIDSATEVKAWNLEIAKSEEDLDDKVVAAIENDLRTTSTRAFINAANKAAGGDAAVALHRHVNAGAFNSINALAMTAGGAPLVDRSVVDVLGIAGAAQVLARRLHADLKPEEIAKLAEGMTEFHKANYLEAGQEALREANSLMDAAQEARLGEVGHGQEFAALQELNQQRKTAVEAANKILATHLGEFEANAALVNALKEGRQNKPLEVPLGGVSDEDAIRQARAIGLQRGDYQLDKVGGKQVLTVTPEGLDKLAKPVDTVELGRVRRNMAIIEGEYDEADWLPSGFAKRPDLALQVPPGVAPTLAQPFAPHGGDLAQSVQDYIGGRAADGDSPADIRADLYSADFMLKSGDSHAYLETLAQVAPLKDAQGNAIRAEDQVETFQKYADAFVASQYGGQIAPIHRQQVTLDQTAAEALHRALASEPAGKAAYQAIGDLTSDDQKTLRDYFYKHVAKDSPQTQELRHRLAAMADSEPEKESQDMFGDTTTNPEWQAWQAQRDTLAGELKAAGLDWATYAEAMGGHVNAYASMQDLIRSQTSQDFAKAYNTLNPDAPIKVGRQVIRNNLNHLDAVDPEARLARQTQERELLDSLRERHQGRYAEGSVSDKLDAARARQEALAQSQMGFFSTEEEPDLFGGVAEAKPAKPLASDERYTLGQAMERQIASLMPTVGAQFASGRPVKLYQPTMSGPKGSPEVMRQRAIKMLAANKRVALAAGTGSGKTAMQLGSFTHLQSQGLAHRGLFLVPSIVQSEFNAEALRFLEPGKFKWHAEPGASREERIAAYKDPSHHFAVMTHQSFRDDMLHLGAQQAGIEPQAMSEKLAKMPWAQRADWIREVMAKEGINFDFLGVDEGHNTLNRQGKDNSAMANIVDALSANTPYYLHATADPIKNDISEAHDLLAKMAPARYADRATFMRRYGPDTAGAKESLKREMFRYVLPFKIDPAVSVERRDIRVDLAPSQQQALTDLDSNLNKIRLARKQGKVDIEALKAVSPESFADVPADQHDVLAKELMDSIGIIRGTATRRILDNHPESGKIAQVLKLASERKGKPGVVFAHSLAAVENLRKQLEAAGHRVGTITGADSAADKAKKIQAFNPDQGERSMDILVASDAGATGANLQSGQWLAQYDTPDTAMVWRQRQGRINRIGQKNNVELLDLIANHPSEERARARLKTKDELRELLTSPMASLDDSGLAHFIKQRQVVQQQASMF